MGRNDSIASASANAVSRLQGGIVKAFTGYYRLKDFISAVRACRTAADERALIARESAAIRSSFKEDINADHRYHNLAKLIYIYLLGHPAHFGQVECMKLAASPRLADKRMGYLGVSLLADEHQQTLLLVTNSLKFDLNSTNPNVVGLALSAMTNIASPDISRDLVDEVERILATSTDPYIRKKAALCAAKMVAKVPDLSENFEERASSLLNDRNHAVILTGVDLIKQLCTADPQLVAKFRKLVPTLVRQLQGLIVAGHTTEYDVSGICDPFLQIKILRLLRMLAKGDQASSDAMNDILNQLATNTDMGRNAGHSVLYETVLTIMAIECDNSLQTMAVNILGKFLGNPDNNIRYVALAMLNRIVRPELTGAVQRHRTTVLSCLNDPDISIRRRAVDLALTLINKDTISAIMSELLDFLRTAEPELKCSLAARLCLAAAQHASSTRWYVDTAVHILGQVDNGAPSTEEIVTSFVRIINQDEGGQNASSGNASTDLRRYATSKLYEVVTSSNNNNNTSVLPPEAIMEAAAWCFGEFGALLCTQGVTTGDGLVNLVGGWISTAMTERLPLSISAGGYLITALGKLSARFPASVPLAKKYLQTTVFLFADNAELQQRAYEMKALVENEALCSVILAHTPPWAAAHHRHHNSLHQHTFSSFSGRASPTQQNARASAELSSLFTGSTTSNGMIATPMFPSNSSNNNNNIFADLATLNIDGIVSPLASAGSAQHSASTSQPQSAAKHDDSVMPAAGIGASSLLSMTSTNAPAASTGKELAWEKAGLGIYIEKKLILSDDDHAGPVELPLTAIFTNSLSVPITEVQLQCAVPKSLRLCLNPATSNVILPSSIVSSAALQPVTQKMVIMPSADNAATMDLESLSKRAKLRFKVTFKSPLSHGDELLTDTFDYTNLEFATTS